MTNDMKNKLIGMHFHGFENKTLIHQGYIVEKLNDNYYLCQTYEWAGGFEDSFIVKSLHDMSEWFFYISSEHMINNYDNNNYVKFRK